MGDKARYKRQTDLWTPGEVLVLRPAVPPDDSTDPPGAGEPPLLVWVQKLNQFEVDEVRSDAEVAQARTVMVYEDEAGEKHAGLLAHADAMDREQLVRAIVAGQFSKHMAEASGELQANPEWHAKLDVIDRTDVEAVPADEAEQVVKLTKDYFEELTNRTEVKDADERARLESLETDVLRKEFVETFVKSRGMDAFTREMRLGEILLGVRVCDATLDANGQWDHAGCTHERLYDDRTEVLALPDRQLALYSSTYNRLNVPVRQAKGSGRAGASSAPSLPPSEQEESPASTPEGTSPAPPTTSA